MYVNIELDSYSFQIFLIILSIPNTLQIPNTLPWISVSSQISLAYTKQRALRKTKLRALIVKML